MPTGKGFALTVIFLIKPPTGATNTTLGLNTLVELKLPFGHIEIVTIFFETYGERSILFAVLFIGKKVPKYTINFPGRKVKNLV